MLNFRKVIEFLFKSFDIAGDTKIIKRLEKDGIRFIMIIKRHWIYGIINLWRVFFVVIITLINSYLLIYGNNENTTISVVVGCILISNVVYWIFIIVSYLHKFYKIQGSEPYIEDIYLALQKSEDSDKIFTLFFNQTLFLFLLLAGITIFTIFTAISNFIMGGTTGAGVGIINAVLILIQFGLFYGYLRNMINQEMDFNVIVPGEILFYNQNGMLGNSQNMNAEKIKTINTKYSGLFASFFNYGDIIVLSEGDSNATGQMVMQYIGNPVKTVKEIQKILDDEKIIKKENLILKKIKYELKIKHIHTPEGKHKIKKYLEEHNQEIRDLFDKSSEEIRDEIRELYNLIN